ERHGSTQVVHDLLVAEGAVEADRLSLRKRAKAVEIRTISGRSYDVERHLRRESLDQKVNALVWQDPAKEYDSAVVRLFQPHGVTLQIHPAVDDAVAPVAAPQPPRCIL